MRDKREEEVLNRYAMWCSEKWMAYSDSCDNIVHIGGCCSCAKHGSCCASCGG